MKILLEIKSGRIIIILKDKRSILEEVSFLEERNLSEKLLPTIDKLLKKNKLQPQDIQDFQVVSDLGENYTTYRLAKTVAEAFKFAVKEKGQLSNKNCAPH
jgi:tRNA A37 threonylcarbamoyladenosine modification protein TsaB